MNKREAKIVADIVSDVMIYTDLEILPESLEVLRRDALFCEELDFLTGIHKRQVAIDTEFGRLMTEKYGHDWYMKPTVADEYRVLAYAQAEDNIDAIEKAKSKESK